MKTFLPLAVVCIVACAAAGTWDPTYRQHFMNTVFAKTKQMNSVHAVRALSKRQIDFGVDIAVRCSAIVWAEQCNGGLIQELVKQYQRCGIPREVVQALPLDCATNAMGLHCGAAEAYIVLVQSIETVCNAVLSESSTCTDGCRNLLMDIRNELGCCITQTFNNSESLFFQEESFRYSLWSDCGVDTVEECPDNSGITIPEVEVDPNCVFLTETFRVTCDGRFASSIVSSLLAEDECAFSAQLYQELCGVNEVGRSCLDLAVEVSLDSASMNCSNTTTCTSNCMTSLEDLVEEAGCCINNIYNGTLAQFLNITVDFLSNEFWSECGLKTPGICEAQLSNATALFSKVATTAITALLLLSSILEIM